MVSISPKLLFTCAHLSKLRCFVCTSSCCNYSWHNVVRGFSSLWYSHEIMLYILTTTQNLLIMAEYLFSDLRTEKDRCAYPKEAGYEWERRLGIRKVSVRYFDFFLQTILRKDLRDYRNWHISLCWNETW